MTDCKKYRVGSRKSELALIQTKHVIELLKNLNPNVEFEIVTMNTLGDKILDIPLPKIGEKSLFTKELESALESGYVHFVVHSLKDLPTSLPKGMAIGAVLTRENPNDALVLQKDLKGYTLQTLPDGSVIGTSSLRRTAQLARKYPNLKVENIRGNLNTRLKKLDDLNKYHAIILASAGLIRMGWNKRISKILDPEDILYAVGQGALAIECKASNQEIIELLEPLYDLQTALRVTAERSFMKTLGGGCSAPVAVQSKLTFISDTQLTLSLTGAVWSLDGKDEIIESSQTNIELKTPQRCSTCPYNNKISPELEDIETCFQCPKNSQPVSKKFRYEEVPAEVLKDDPHESCPVQIPVGADFMGKCPYLEATGNKCPVNGKIENLEGIVLSKQCPFREFKVLEEGDNKKEEDEEGLFCGLVGHSGISKEGLLEAVKLGYDLAKRLESLGAIEVMKKAQEVVHKTVEKKADVSSSS